MRSYIFLIFVLAGSLSSFCKDVVIFRTGAEYEGDVKDITPKEILFCPYSSATFLDSTARDGLVKLNPKLLYLLRLEGRGNYYFTEDGKRITGEMRKEISKDADAIYLLSGKEIISYHTVIDRDRVIVQPEKKNKISKLLSKRPIMTEEIAISDIFFIRYADGKREFFNELIPSIIEENTTDKPQEIKIKFYTVKKGETLADIARKNGVSVEDIKKWNEYPDSYKPSRRLVSGEQIMLYITDNPE